MHVAKMNVNLGISSSGELEENQADEGVETMMLIVLGSNKVKELILQPKRKVRLVLLYKVGQREEKQRREYINQNA